MRIEFVVPPNTLQCETRVLCEKDENGAYGGMFVGRNSYAIKLFMDTGVEYTRENGYVIHNFHVGKYNSIGQNLEVVMGRNHSTRTIDTGALRMLLQEQGVKTQFESTYVQKGSIVIQNDVWLGENVTIMPGVIVRNGAVIARNSHVVKNVPPYAIVGGNPAKVIGYRFTEGQIKMLQEIQWWNWDTEKLIENGQYFTEDIESFCSKFYPEAHVEWEGIRSSRVMNKGSYFVFVDYYDKYADYLQILENFVNTYKTDAGKSLTLFVQDDIKDHNIDESVYDYLMREIGELDRTVECHLELARGSDSEAKEVFINCENYIISRTYRTVYYTCMADMLDINIISGVDKPLCL